MHTSMGLFSSVQMASQGEFSPFFYLFCWLSWKVSPLWSTLNQFTNILYRIILATIQYLGGCPCPCCFIRKDQISALGTKADDQQRSHLCTDTEDWQYKVNKTWTWILNNGWGVNSKWVEDLLQADSWIPTHVCGFISQLFFTYWFLIECLFIQIISIQIQFFFYGNPWSPSWIWAQGLESNFYSSHASVVCHWFGWHSSFELVVSPST